MLQVLQIPAWAALLHAESIEWFIEDQPFLPSYDLAPTPPPPPSSAVSRLYLFVFSVFLCFSPVELTELIPRRESVSSIIIQ
jgi:hypothetical protein